MDFFDFVKSNRLIILFISVFINIILLGTSIYFIYKNVNFSCPSNDSLVEKINSNIAEESYNKTFYVEVKGAVKKPGVYKVSNNNIINEVITMAGGFNKNAYTKNINLSRKVSDELVIYIYTATEYKNKFKTNTNNVTNNTTETKTLLIDKACECSTYDISNCIDNYKSEIISSEKDTNYESNNAIINNSESSIENDINNVSNLININTATKEELMKLSGIGESKAEDIITYRNTSGNFTTIEEIKNVSGIGDALFNKIKDYITV